MAKNSNVRCIIIDAKNKEVREKVYPKLTLEDLQAAVEGYIELIRLDSKNDLYVNEEGRLRGIPYGFTLSCLPHHNNPSLVGNAIILSHDDEGDGASTTLSLEEIRARVEFHESATPPLHSEGCGKGPSNYTL